MAINYSIQANVIDITIDTPKANDVFLVDTNVWYWITYSKASQSGKPPTKYQTTSYPNYTNNALVAGAKIHQSCITFAELTHLIEEAEREIFEKSNGLISRKEYRHNYPKERSQVVAEVQTAWSQVNNLANPLSVTIDTSTADAALARFQTEKVDGYDLFILESMKMNGVVQVITDDGDFSTVPGIQVFTANRKVISAASTQGKLVRR